MASHIFGPQKNADSHRRKLAALAPLLAFVLVACSNGSPALKQNTEPPKISSTGVTITDLDAAAVLSGTCDDIGKMDRGFSLQLDGSTWVSQPSLTCTNGTFSIRINSLGREMGFIPRKRATRIAVVRRTAITGKTSESNITVTYVPNVIPGGFSEGGGIATAPGKYIMRGSFSGVQKESSSVHESADHKYKMILNRDKGEL